MYCVNPCCQRDCNSLKSLKYSNNDLHCTLHIAEITVVEFRTRMTKGKFLMQAKEFIFCFCFCRWVFVLALIIATTKAQRKKQKQTRNYLLLVVAILCTSPRDPTRDGWIK